MLKPLIVAAGALLSVTLVSNQSASAAGYRHLAYGQAAIPTRTYARPAFRATGYARTGYARTYAPQRYAAAPAFRGRRLPVTRTVAAYRTIARPRFVQRPVVPATPAAQIIGTLLGAQPLVAQPTPASRPAYRMAGPAIRTAMPALGGGGQVGRASYYAMAGRTASGGSVGGATCAHRSLPFGTQVLVTNLATARQMVLTVNDRGPFVGGRIIDVSRTAAGYLGMLGSGTAPVRVQVVGHS